METGTRVLEMRGPRLRRMGRDAVVMVVATTMLVGGTYLWQHAQVDDRQVALGRAVSAGDAAHSQVSALEGQVAGLRGQIETLSVGKQHTAAQLRATRRRLSRAEARMTALLGSPLAARRRAVLRSGGRRGCEPDAAAARDRPRDVSDRRCRSESGERRYLAGR